MLDLNRPNCFLVYNIHTSVRLFSMDLMLAYSLPSYSILQSYLNKSTNGWSTPAPPLIGGHIPTEVGVELPRPLLVLNGPDVGVVLPELVEPHLLVGRQLGHLGRTDFVAEPTVPR